MIRIVGVCCCFVVLSWGGAAAAKQHVVQSGESLWAIAKAHSVSVQALRDANNMPESSTIRPGQKLNVPGQGASKSQSESGSPSKKAKTAKPKSKNSARAGKQASAPQAGKSSGRFLEKPNPPWVLAKPSRETQVEKGIEERGGINPCMTPDPGFASYGRWRWLPIMGQLLLPKRSPTDAKGDFNLFIHFHGHEPARKEWVQAMDSSVLVAIDLGISSGAYYDAFQDPSVFRYLVQGIEKEVEQAYNLSKAKVKNIGLSSWSAGYGAVGQILSQKWGKERVDKVVLLDGLHTGYWGPNLNALRLGPYIEYAKRAARGDALFFVSHSSIIPQGYASTTETANYLVWRVDGQTKPATPRASDPLGLELISRFDKRGFHVRGFSGHGVKDHCAQLGLLRDVLKVYVKPEWEPESKALFVTGDPVAQN